MGILKKTLRRVITPPKYIGWKGETAVIGRLGWLDLFGYAGKELHNLYVPCGNGQTTEIDVLYITQKGIFVLESKNYSGFIFGSESRQYWTSTLFAGKNWIGRKKVEKHSFYNPVWQNQTHIRCLKRYLDRNIPMFSVVVFSDRCELKEISCTSPDVVVCQQHQLGRCVRSAWGTFPDVLTAEEIGEIYERLLPLTHQSQAVKGQHVREVRKRPAMPGSCPRCGGKLVLRTARKGPNAGKQFYGCSNYPRCSYTKNC